MIARRSFLLGMVTQQAPAVTHKYLALDRRVFDRVEGLRLSPGTVRKEARNPLFGENRPWEPRFDNLYPTVLFDEPTGMFPCWYSPFIVDETASATPRAQRNPPYKPGKREMGVCYAVSRDGIVWTKPELGLVEFGGSRRNNLVARGPHGVGILHDARDPDPACRYKMFYKGGHMAARFSPDGVHWSGEVEFPEIEARGDTHNNALWVPELSRYAGFTRLWDGRQRLVGRTESPDFRRWTKAVEVFRSLPDEGAGRQTYSMPVFGHANLYLGLVAMFAPQSDTVDCELAWSADTVRWERLAPRQPLIPRGASGACDSGCIYAACPVFREDEILLYYGASNGPHTGWRDGSLCLAHLRPDGFAGLEPASAGAHGSAVTRPLECAGGRLYLTADAAGGRVRVGIEGDERRRIELCDPLRADVSGAAVKWQGAASLDNLRGRSIRLHMEIQSAKVYSFSL